jgi:C4-dicarboxylate transporter DctM subunit
MTIVALFVLLIVLIFLTVPIGIAVALASFGVVSVTGVTDVGMLTRTLITSFDSFPVLAIPLFILAGELLSQGGITERLFDFARLFVGKLTGGIPMAAVLACLLFGALSGSASADAAAIGTLMIPMMIKMGYPSVFSSTLVASAAGTDSLMPPGISIVVYGVMTSTSIGDLFIGGILPACLIGVALMIYAYFYCRINGYTNDKMDILPAKYTALQVMRRAIIPLMAPVIIMGGIYGGIFTPTEAAAIVCVYAIIVSMFIYKSLKLKDLFVIIRRSAIMCGPVLVILGTGYMFSRTLASMNATQIVGDFIMQFAGSRTSFMLVTMAVLVFMGIFMDTLSFIIILTPVFFPIAMSLGINPVHYGVVMIMCAVIGYITPPMSQSLFIVSKISGDSVNDLARGIGVPFLVLVVCLFIIAFVPELTMVLIS